MEQITKTKLLEELEVIRSQGYALGKSEHEEDMMCIAGPIFNHHGEIEDSVSISGPYKRLKNVAMNRKIIKAIKEISHKISTKMGCV